MEENHPLETRHEQPCSPRRPMLTISREVRVKIGKHAWAVYPLEAFGYLLGRVAEGFIFAALPCSQTRQWHEFADRWVGLEEHLNMARQVARVFGLEVTGYYASTQDSSDYPMPSAIMQPGQIVLVYTTRCCPHCSWFGISHHDRWLQHGEEFTLGQGKRLTNAVNQKRVLKEWRRVYGGLVANPACGSEG